MIKIIKKGMPLEKDDKNFAVSNIYQSRTPKRCSCNC